MFRNSPGVEQLSADLQKKSRQIDMLESTIAKLNNDLEASKKQIAILRKVCFNMFLDDPAWITQTEGAIFMFEHATF